MSDATPPPDSIFASPAFESNCATPPPAKSACTTPTVDNRATATAYYYISSKGRRRYPDTSSLIPYKPLPEGWDISEHYWLYGWPISDRQLQSILRDVFNLPIAGTTPRDEFLDARCVERILRLLSGYEYLFWFICKPTEETMAEGIVEDLPPGPPGIPLVTLSCTARRRFFMQRPNVEQMKYLTSILGEPRWLESQHLKKDFPFECFE
ncbi:hypothetical protein AGABI1DRAFT_106735 [Agaricus bisporus var. burnettii JB137-S8]|uniref:Uncharacterized protein n=1 Tax=Agaricus bisporus var. burnettii (strain JB137-S8 / ATCC MYA-4627 / FGSC 10392) TaxID=597362 RepID=K5X863_AGABU|nr:uncharacterized protein AGABI1DRAFT_106735 [Agaricus bisporus var. burnettii JB137-S8]EKM79157.1 hypothetical protein AGABI1DRAFT_106735 [Agaricus bisporus var. burnettii JB137-S8]